MVLSQKEQRVGAGAKLYDALGSQTDGAPTNKLLQDTAAAKAGLAADNTLSGTNTFTQQVRVLDLLASSVQNLSLNTLSKLAAFVVGLATRLGSTTNADPAATTSSVSNVLSRVFGLSDRLDLLAKFIIRWDQEKRITLDNDYQGGLTYTSGQAFAFTPGAYAAGIIKLSASDYGRNGDLVAVRVTPGGKDLVFDKGAAQAFHSATGPTTLPALAGMQYIFHLVRPDGNSTDGSYWVVHSTPSTGSGTPGTARDPLAIGDNGAVTAAVLDLSNTWVKGDLTAFGSDALRNAGAPAAVSGQNSSILVGTADVATMDEFDKTDANGNAWRCRYSRRNDGTSGWTRLGKTA